MRLNVRAFAVACGVIWGFGLVALTWWRLLFEEEQKDETIIGHKYRGYSVSPMGSIVGLGWGLLDGAVKGAAFAWLYNRLADRMPMRISL